ncbi:C6 finger domain protein, putative [Talaromyces stipitatus ATCC 10500]|uniref:C6 finger domain protein, putative n=1 Tax=Talaromyces stipitatus (strain ATCC 10500 / CBS 375.48 / QM 6759 / NRRL 1006) TaxID=441959 RepID=B8M058_TALSN|nr:C6 finger domain protein, putative [Talaromyces stipitatus ATCC 10500]EED21155.1 C6 finger domain protein, putative [Talaromyces stipitatus ATCC 10500]
MPGVPSNKACDRCKKRHVKCDEGRPECQRCVTAGVKCPGYSQDRKFIDQGATVRRRYAPYQREDSRSQSSQRSVRAGTDEESRSVQPDRSQQEVDQREVPGQNPVLRSSRSSTTDDQVNPSASGNPDGVSGNTMALDQEPTIATTAPYTNIALPANFLDSTQQPLSEIPNTETLAYTTNFNLLNPLQSPMFFSNGSATSGNLNSATTSNYAYTMPDMRNVNAFGDLYSELMINSDREIAFLKRHYVEFISPWLDLHDSEKFFMFNIPKRSLQVPFIQYAILAIAAKHLARVNGVRPGLTSTLNLATTESYPNAGQVDWLFKATNYYYQALFHLKQLLFGHADFQQLDTTISPIQILCQDLEIDLMSEGSRRVILPPSFISYIDDILPGVVILTVFDILDKPGTEWEKRLLGLRHLMQAMLTLPISPNRNFTMSRALQVSFWNLAYLDSFASYANRRRTRMDAYNFDLFRAAGLSIDDCGKLYPKTPSPPTSIQRDDFFLRGITFIVLKLMNFIAEFKEIQQSATATSSPVPDFLSNISVPQTSGLGVTWNQLVQEVNNWHDSLPDTFEPYIRLENPHDLVSPTSSSISLPFPEIVFSNATHAATVALFDFARIILLLNRPHESQSVARDRLVEYREITKEVDTRVREIAGIAMGRTSTAVQIHLVQPLYVVGLCDDRTEARQKVVELMRVIRAESGWETDYKIAQLHELWKKT